MRVRAAKPSDFQAVQTLVFDSHASALSARGYDVRARLPQIFPTLASADLFTAPTSHYWVAEAEEGGGDARVVGAISIISPGPAAAVVVLNAFFVATQRRGVGSRLMTTALAFCRAAAVKTVKLTSNRGIYDAAIGYYKRLGFRALREYEVVQGIVLLDMELELRHSTLLTYPECAGYYSEPAISSHSASTAVHCLYDMELAHVQRPWRGGP